MELGQRFEQRLDLFGEKKKVMRECVVNVLKRIAIVSNVNLVENADGLLSRREKDIEVDWVEKTKTRGPSEKFKTSY